MTTIKNFVRYIKEELDEPVVDPNPMVDVPTEEDPEELFRFHLSDKLKKLVRPLKGDFKVAELLHNLGVAVPRKVLAKYPVDYIDIEDDGYFSYLKSRYLEEPDLWKSNRRVKQKITKAIREMYNETYLNSYVKEVDFVDFVNKLAALKDNEAKVYEWRGDEVLRAYNYKNECDPQFGFTCANFKQDTGRFGNYKEPTVDEFDIYTKNPENCGAVVVIESGLIKGRRSFQQGYNVCDSGRFRKDKIGTIWGNYYGINGRGSKYDMMIKEYLQKKYDAVEMSERGFCIKLETRFAHYCPFDSMQVCFEENLLCHQQPPELAQEGYRNLRWEGTYHANCPENLVKQRIKEEKAKAEAVAVPNFFNLF